MVCWFRYSIYGMHVSHPATSPPAHHTHTHPECMEVAPPLLTQIIATKLTVLYLALKTKLNPLSNLIIVINKKPVK